jgi:hypothetical protein
MPHKLDTFQEKDGYVFVPKQKLTRKLAEHQLTMYFGDQILFQVTHIYNGDHPARPDETVTHCVVFTPETLNNGEIVHEKGNQANEWLVKFTKKHQLAVSHEKPNIVCQNSNTTTLADHQNNPMSVAPIQDILKTELKATVDQINEANQRELQASVSKINKTIRKEGNRTRKTMRAQMKELLAEARNKDGPGYTLPVASVEEPQEE